MIAMLAVVRNAFRSVPLEPSSQTPDKKPEAELEAPERVEDDQQEPFRKVA
jgi:hypothetical protein